MTTNFLLRAGLWRFRDNRTRPSALRRETNTCENKRREALCTSLPEMAACGYGICGFSQLFRPARAAAKECGPLRIASADSMRR